MKRPLIYRNGTDEITVTVDWPDNINYTPPPEVAFTDADGVETHYTYKEPA